MSHDERNIPIEYEPARAEWLETAWLGIKRLLARRNAIDIQRQAVRELDRAVAELVHYGRKIEQRRRGVLCGDADAEAQDWAEFRAALAKVGGAP